MLQVTGVIVYKTWCKAGPTTTIRYATDAEKDAQTIPAEEGMFEANAEISMCDSAWTLWTHGTLE